MQSEQLFEVALGVKEPWYIREVRFDAEAKMLMILIDFKVGRRFVHPEVPGKHPVHDTQSKQQRRLNFFNTSASCHEPICPTALFG